VAAANNCDVVLKQLFPVLQQLQRGIATGRAHDAAAWMRG
jgi:hypothetical protein